MTKPVCLSLHNPLCDFPVKNDNIINIRQIDDLICLAYLLHKLLASHQKNGNLKITFNNLKKGLIPNPIRSKLFTSNGTH